MAGRFTKRIEMYELPSDEENEPDEVSEFDQKCDEEVAGINSPGVSNIIAVKKEIPQVLEISEDQGGKTDEEEVTTTMEVIVNPQKVKREEDEDIQIITELIRPKVKKEDEEIQIISELLIRPKKVKREDGDDVKDITPETICLDGVPKENPHRPIGNQETMKYLKTNSRVKKLRQKPGYIQYGSQWYPEGYARKYCEWYERHLNPFLQAKLAPHLKYYQHLTSNPTEINEACSSQSLENGIPTNDLNIQTEENVETVAVNTAQKNYHDEEMASSEGNLPMSAAVSCENEGEFQNPTEGENREEFQNPTEEEYQEEFQTAAGNENQEEFENATEEENWEKFQNPGDNEIGNEPSLVGEALSQDLPAVNDGIQWGDLQLDSTILKMIQETPTTELIKWLSDLLEKD